MPIDTYDNSVFGEWDKLNLVEPSQQNSTLVYPNDVWDASSRPLIQFYCSNVRKSLGQSFPINIFFPIPQGLDFSDGASYDDSALGVLGGAVVDAARSYRSAGGGTAGMSNVADSLAAKATGGSIQDIITKAAAAVPMGDQFRSAASVAMQSTINRNIVTEFTGVGTRAYTFKFKMIAINKSESDTIKNICHIFRLGMYPEGDAAGLALKYPPTWVIRFITRDGGEIGYIPKIFECYLTTVNTAYNSSGNLWHTDGSPLECDLTIAFKETRALTAKDIALLDQGGFSSISFPDKVNIPQDIIEQVALAVNTNQTEFNTVA